MIDFIKFAEIDADGCGTYNDILIQVEGKTELTNGVIERTKKEIEKYKKQNPYEWDTNGAIEAACEHLKTAGYICNLVSPSYCIDF